MPAYAWLEKRVANQDGDIKNKLHVLVKLGHPYSDDDIEKSESMLEGKSELDALITYLQVLGTAYAIGEQ